MATFKYQSLYLKTKYSLGSDLASILYRSRFQEVMVPDILYYGIEHMGKYYDCANENNVSMIQAALKLRKENGWGYQEISTEIGGPSKSTLQDMVECRIPKWEWLRIIRSDIWQQYDI
jgi:hypothetical protein